MIANAERHEHLPREYLNTRQDFHWAVRDGSHPLPGVGAHGSQSGHKRDHPCPERSLAEWLCRRASARWALGWGRVGVSVGDAVAVLSQSWVSSVPMPLPLEERRNLCRQPCPPGPPGPWPLTPDP